MSNDYYTEDLAEFGARERKIAGQLLTHYLPENFDDTGVKLAMNKNSGYVFLVNEDYQVAMLNGGRLEIFHTLPYSGGEGFLQELLEENSPLDLNSEDSEYLLREAEEDDNCTLPKHWQSYIAEGH
jgi:hypothetical protein